MALKWSLADRLLLGLATVSFCALLGTFAWTAETSRALHAYPVGSSAASLLSWTDHASDATAHVGTTRILLWFDPNCVACIELLPDLKELLRGEPFIVLTSGDAAVVVEHLKSNNLTPPVVTIDAKAARFRISPALLVLDAAGTVRASFNGRPRDTAEVQQRAEAIHRALQSGLR